MLRAVARSVDDDLTVVRTVLPPSWLPGEYGPPLPPLGVPSLVWFCLNRIYHHPDQIHIIPFRLNYRNELNDLDLLNLDPRLWATLVQVYDNLPEKLSTYVSPLNDAHMPLLQAVPCTPRFSLITILEASACTTLCDENITDLKALHSLTALDASDTCVTSYGVKILASSLQEFSGPWPLRILCFRNCRSITAEVYLHLTRFPLLSVVDVRGTKCAASVAPPTPFRSAGSPLFFHPTPLSDSLAHLREVSPSIYSSQNAFTLLINALDHKPSKQAPRNPVYHDNTVITFSSTSDRLHIANADAIARRAQAREDAERHTKNKEAWYERQDAILDGNIAPATPYMNCSVSSSSKQTITAPRPLARQTLSSSRSGSSTTLLADANSLRPMSTTITHPGASVAGSRNNSRHADSNVAVPAAMTARASSSTLPRPDIPHNAPRRSVSSRPRLPELDEALAAYRKALPRPKDTVTGKARTTTWANREDEPFMLYRDPPPWAALDEAKCTMRSEEERRRKQVKSNIAMRQCDVAKVELSGGKAAAVKQQLENLLAKRRTQMREDFGLESKPRSLTTAPSQPKSNPFGRRPDVAPKPTFTAPPTPTLSASSSRELIPISRVRTPVFTQELLDVSSKENKKALKAGSEGIDPPAKRQKRSSLPSSSKQPQTLAPEKSGSTVDLRKWFTKKA